MVQNQGYHEMGGRWRWRLLSRDSCPGCSVWRWSTFLIFWNISV